MFELSLILLLAVVGFLVGLSKSGFLASLGGIGVPLLTLLLSPRDAAGALLPVLLVMDAFALIVYRRQVDWRILGMLVPGALVGTAVAWSMSSIISDAAVRLLIGIISVVFVMDAWFPLRKKLADVQPSRGWGAFWGAISGFTSFVSHTGAPPIQIYMVPLKLSPALFAGTFAVFFAIVNAVKIPPYIMLGQLNTDNLMLSALMLPLACVGMALGVFLVRRIKAGLFYTITYWIVLMLGLKLIYDGVVGIWF